MRENKLEIHFENVTNAVQRFKNQLKIIAVDNKDFLENNNLKLDYWVTHIYNNYGSTCLIENDIIERKLGNKIRAAHDQCFSNLIL